MKYFAIESKSDSKSKKIEKRLDEDLRKLGYLYDDKNPDFVFIVGGDGKLIRSIHNHLNRLDKTLFITIMTGTLGFYMYFYEQDIPELLNQLQANSFVETQYNLLQVETNLSETFYAINEVRVENRVRTSIIDVTIDQKYFETFRGNGLVISTPFGSSAYNRSLGGALIGEDLEVIQLTEIAGIHHNSYRSLGSPLILSKNHSITLKSNDIKSSIIGYDHLNYRKDGVASIRVTLSNKKVRIMNKKEYTYYDRLRDSFM